MASSKRQYTAAVLGAAGGIGQPLSLLLNQCPYVKELHLYDVVPVVAGVAVDISHIEKGVTVKGYAGDFKDPELSATKLREALEGVDICVIPAGVPRKPGMTRADLFQVNAGIVKTLIEGICEVCPKAMICIISNPVNSTVPIAAEVLKANNCYDPKRLFGVSTLDIVRANKFVAEAAGKQPEDVNVTVIGGHSGKTILPLLSQIEGVKLSADEIEALTSRIQSAGTEVVEAKAGGGSATLSMAYAGARFATSVMKGMAGEKNIVECSYVDSNVTELAFFASPVKLGKNGIQEVMSFSKLSDFEEGKLTSEVLPDLTAAIDNGKAFMAKSKQ